ncbi:helix-turn-helix domain-containing protein [Jannaschia aquimarina]|uniref:XylR_2 protein n=1 Tax=Jannaschia aquimarina TaxID=935700 RepID=A0A0D1DE19_9RHOB|nr:AraC family transcriptional regulator [Jannaschia aquimarina]KIT18203.1 Xylose operon regulatory protein [Jannaschia aquimarina]SNS83512.1 AraC-type DNA-binding protein [Jannaschia aquimarina]
MMDASAIDSRGDLGATGSFRPYLSPRSHSCDATGMTITALSPGKVDLSLAAMLLVLNVVPSRPSATPYHYRLNGEDIARRVHTAEGAAHAFFAGGDMELSCHNHDWECLVEFDGHSLEAVISEALEMLGGRLPEFASTFDAAVCTLARMAISHLRFGEPDRLYVEGLTVAMNARVLSLGRGAHGAAAVDGTDPRIACAIDYIEAHLGEDLSVAAIASAAAMSPSWFRSSFRAAMGQPVFAFARERRLERARPLLADHRLSLAQIAFTCGFSSHSHMTRLFAARYGASPKEMR